MALVSRAVGVASGPSSQCRTAVERLRGPRAPPRARAEGAAMRPGKTFLRPASRKATKDLAGVASTAPYWECHSNHVGLVRIAVCCRLQHLIAEADYVGSHSAQSTRTHMPAPLNSSHRCRTSIGSTLNVQTGMIGTQALVSYCEQEFAGLMHSLSLFTLCSLSVFIPVISVSCHSYIESVNDSRRMLYKRPLLSWQSCTGYCS